LVRASEFAQVAFAFARRETFDSNVKEVTRHGDKVRFCVGPHIEGIIVYDFPEHLFEGTKRKEDLINTVVTNFGGKLAVSMMYPVLKEALKGMQCCDPDLSREERVH